MKKYLIPVLFASTTLLTGCLEQQSSSSANLASIVKKEDAVAAVNGKYISKKELDTLKQEIARRSQGQQFPEKQLVEELVQRELLVQDALNKKLDQSPEFIEKINTVRNSLLSQMAIQDYIKSHPVTEAELKAEYEAQVGSGGTEYKARHILLKTEEDAKKVIAELDKGADFVKLAKSKSTGPSGPQGGDLGWFTADRMVAPFSEAVAKLEDGQYTKEPVKTQFGWHVILREESRKQTPPPFEAVKEQLKPIVQRKKIRTMLDNLKNQAKVEILLPSEAEKAPAESKVEQAEAVQEAKETAENAADKAEEKAQQTDK